MAFVINWSCVIESAPVKLVLASGSPYRQRLLARFRVPFVAISPDINEKPLAGETGVALARRLATEKAQAITGHSHAWIIGSDQVAECNGELLGKPGSIPAAERQLAKIAGERVAFHTGLAVLAPGDRQPLVEVVRYEVVMKPLSEIAIKRYIALDEPTDCAGSFKWESLGIALFEQMIGEDPTALEGLPLIALYKLLERAEFPDLPLGR